MSDVTDVFDLASRANTAEASNTRFALERALAVLSSGDFLYEGGHRQSLPDGAQILIPWAQAPMPATPLQVPLGTTSLHPNPLSLPVVAMVVDTADKPTMQTRLSELLVENNARPFCRCLLVTSDLRLLPFVGLLGLAVCPKPQDLNDAFFGMLNVKYNVSTVVSLTTGALLAELLAR